MIFPYLTSGARSACAADRRRIHAKEKDEKHDDGGRRLRLEGDFRQVGPEIDLDRQYGCRFGEARGNIDDEGHHADHQQRRGFAERVRHADDRAGHDAGHRERQHVVEDRLLVRGADAESCFLDRGRHRLQRGARGDDDRGQHQKRQHQAADQRRRARQAEEIEEHRKAEQAEDDRGHRGEIVDIHLDELGQPVLRREFFEIDRRRDADRQAERPG